MSTKTYSTTDVAAKVGISRQTLYTWVERGWIDAPKPIRAGNASILVWTEKQLAGARKFKGTLRRGPKRKDGKR